MNVGVDGWLDDVCRVPSPNFDARPVDTRIELVVIHNISLPPGCYGGGHIARLFTNTLDPAADPYFAEIAEMCVSAHVLIERDGSATQFVSFTDRAWHAGASTFEGRSRCNDFSVGIELEGTDCEPFTDAQYHTLTTLLAALRITYPIKALRGHSDISPDRKTDPGPFFDWGRVDKAPGAAFPPV